MHIFCDNLLTKNLAFMGIYNIFCMGYAHNQWIFTVILAFLGIESQKDAPHAHILTILWASNRLICSAMPKTAFFSGIKYNFWALEQEKSHLCPFWINVLFLYALQLTKGKSDQFLFHDIIYFLWCKHNIPKRETKLHQVEKQNFIKEFK